MVTPETRTLQSERIAVPLPTDQERELATLLEPRVALLRTCATSQSEENRLSIAEEGPRGTDCDHQAPQALLASVAQFAPKRIMRCKFLVSLRFPNKTCAINR